MSIARKIKKALNVEVIEKQKLQFERDYLEIEEFCKTDKFKEFEELDVIIHSNDFVNNKKKIEGLSYKRSMIYNDIKKFKKLSVNKKIKTYLRVEASGVLEEYLNFLGSELYLKLKGIKNCKSKDLKKEDKECMTRYFHDKKIKSFYKFEKSKEYRIYKVIENTQILKEYLEFKQRVESEAFVKERNYLLNKDRYTITYDYSLLEKYNLYIKMPVVKKYLEYKDTNLFDFIKNWKLAFEDDFKDGRLNLSKWGYISNAAKKIISSNFSLQGDKHFFTDGNNVSLQGNNLCILTKRESLEGVLFDPLLGFKKDMFNYSSGIVTSLGLFAQKYGKFEAKIKFGNMAVNQCFWLAGNKPTPHIDIIKSQSSRKSLCSLIPNINQSIHEKIRKLDLSNEFYLYTIEVVT